MRGPRILLLLMWIMATNCSEQKLFRTSYIVEVGASYRGLGTVFDSCSSASECSQRCLQDTACDSATYNSTSSTCTLYEYALLDRVASFGKTDMLYLESVCARLSGDRSSTCSIFTVNYKDCQEYFENGHRRSGVYQLELPGLEPVHVWCNFDLTNGWTVIQKRQNGSVDFYLDWADYKNGFGSVSGEHWLGNDRIHALTQTNQKLHIYLEAADGTYRNGYWQQFYIADESDNYRLTVSADNYTGDAEEGLTYTHNGMQFTTRDRDNDLKGSHNCAVQYSGAWWYNGCHHVCLNGVYSSSGVAYSTSSAVNWCCDWKNHGDSLLKTTMSVSRS